MTSSLIQFVSSASRASSAVRMASLAVWQPAVLGRKWTLSASRSTRLSSSAARLTRRIDAVTISVPLAATASSMILRFGYPAVPRNKREWNVRPAIINKSDWSCIDLPRSPPLQYAYDLDAITGFKRRCGPCVAPQHGAIEGNGNPPAVGLLGLQDDQRRNGGHVQLFFCSVYSDACIH